MNIHTILSQGEGVQLGPVNVTKTYPRKPGDKNRFVLIEDSSGKGALKIWGAAANTELQEGQVITLVGTGPRGGLKTSEYNGKVSIDANDCRIELDGQTQSAPARTAHAPSGAAAPAYGADQPVPCGLPGEDRLEATMARAAKATAFYVESLVLNGFTKDEAIMLAQNAGSLYPLWWFGAKGGN